LRKRKGDAASWGRGQLEKEKKLRSERVKEEEESGSGRHTSYKIG